MSDRLAEVLEYLDPETLTTGHGFTEGPVWHSDGYLLFTDVPYVYRLDVDTRELALVRERNAGSNGMTLELTAKLFLPLRAVPCSRVLVK